MSGWPAFSAASARRARTVGSTNSRQREQTTARARRMHRRSIRRRHAAARGGRSSSRACAGGAQPQERRRLARPPRRRRLGPGGAVGVRASTAAGARAQASSGQQPPRFHTLCIAHRGRASSPSLSPLFARGRRTCVAPSAEEVPPHPSAQSVPPPSLTRHLSSRANPLALCVLCHRVRLQLRHGGGGGGASASSFVSVPHLSRNNGGPSGHQRRTFI